MMHEREDGEPRLEFGGPFGPGPRETVADLMRRAREEIGQDLRSVAEILRIRATYLEAIECGDFDRLPGTTYAVGFLRTYADYLGLDGEDIVERFKAETQAAAHRSELIFPEPVAESRIPGGAIIFVSLVMLAVAYGGWFYLSQQGRTVADLIPDWPSQAPAETQTAVAPKSDPAPVAATPEPAAPAAVTPEPAAAPTDEAVQPPAAPEIVAATTPPVAPVQEPAPARAAEVETPAAPTEAPVATAPSPSVPNAAAAEASPARQAPTLATVAAQAAAPAEESAPEPASETTEVASLVDQTVVIPAPPTSSETVIIPDDRSPRVYGGSNDESRIVIRALQDSWVQVRDAQDAILLTRVLRAGDSYRVPDVSGLTLLTGNAGGIELEVDGVQLPPVGPPGSVRRSIALDPARLLNGPAAAR